MMSVVIVRMNRFGTSANSKWRRSSSYEPRMEHVDILAKPEML
jgi:hypothetical protein